MANDEPITLFTQDGCVDSARVRTCLALAGVPFIERNVTQDPAAVAALLTTGLFATPVVVISDRVILAARRDALAKALGFTCRCPDLAA